MPRPTGNGDTEKKSVAVVIRCGNKCDRLHLTTKPYKLLILFESVQVRLKRPFSVHPWIDSEEHVRNLFLVWRICMAFADVLGLWPFTLDEFVQSLHDYIIGRGKSKCLRYDRLRIDAKFELASP
nr:homeobox-DDT domain protein [Tanacetum cinerariifolium]